MQDYKIISWDVGIKNLSYCILSKNIEYDTNPDTNSKYIIHNWDIIDISNTGNEIIISNICESTNKKGIKCTKTAKYHIDNTKYFCGIHCRKEPKRIPIKKSKKKNIPILTLGTNMYNKLDLIPDILDVKEVLIENQPCLKSPAMKSIQILLYSYFIMKGIINTESIIDNIKMISASNKLKNCDKDLINLDHIKSKYTKRKKLGIAYCESLILNDTTNHQYFISNKKKDDLADSMLQGVYYLEK
jgi:hypothetical protein